MDALKVEHASRENRLSREFTIFARRLRGMPVYRTLSGVQPPNSCAIRRIGLRVAFHGGLPR
jgi:hypothetical protein